MTFLYNAWYPAAWSSEVGEDFLTRTFLDTPVMLYRDADGHVIAMHDQCPHRFAPLSMGKLVDGRVRCGYHGLEFNSDGQCVGSCISATAPKAARVRTFPVVEQDLVVWIWMGANPPSDPADLQRFPFHDKDDASIVYGVTVAQSDYRLLSDNLLDLTHVHLVHPGFGGIEFPSHGKAHEEGNAIVSVHLSDFPEAPTREENIIRWTAPSNHYLESLSTPRGGETAMIPSAHLLTPETARSTHYFWSSGTPEGFTVESNLEFLDQLFNKEDKPMVEAVQRRMGDREFWDLKPLLLASDAGAVRMRRKLSDMIDKERAEAGSQASD